MNQEHCQHWENSTWPVDTWEPCCRCGQTGEESAYCYGTEQCPPPHQALVGLTRHGAGVLAAHAIGNFLGWCYPEPWPCPRCGAGGYVAFAGAGWLSECNGCQGKHWDLYGTRSESVAWWNRRAPLVIP